MKSNFQAIQERTNRLSRFSSRSRDVLVNEITFYPDVQKFPDGISSVVRKQVSQNIFTIIRYDFGSGVLPSRRGTNDERTPIEIQNHGTLTTYSVRYWRDLPSFRMDPGIARMVPDDPRGNPITGVIPPSSPSYRRIRCRLCEIPIVGVDPAKRNVCYHIFLLYRHLDDISTPAGTRPASRSTYQNFFVPRADTH